MNRTTNSIIRFFSVKKEPYFFLLQEILGFKPKNIEIYKQAFVHRSALGGNNKNLKSNERLEYLGDAMLSAAIADILYNKYPEADEGFLTQRRAMLVQRTTLDNIASRLNLSELMITQKKLQISEGSHIAGNALEALIGAIYKDQGYDCCKNFVIRLINKGYFESAINQHLSDQNNEQSSTNVTGLQSKIDLLQWAQKRRLEVRIDIDEIPSTDSKGSTGFNCTVYIENIEAGHGSGTSKKAAQAIASAESMRMIKEGIFDSVEPSDPRHKGPRPSRKQRIMQNKQMSSENPKTE